MFAVLSALISRGVEIIMSRSNNQEHKDLNMWITMTIGVPHVVKGLILISITLHVCTLNNINVSPDTSYTWMSNSGNYLPWLPWQKIDYSISYSMYNICQPSGKRSRRITIKKPIKPSYIFSNIINISSFIFPDEERWEFTYFIKYNEYLTFLYMYIHYAYYYFKYAIIFFL